MAIPAYRALYESRCDSFDRALEFRNVRCGLIAAAAGRLCGYLRCLSEPPLYFNSVFFTALAHSRAYLKDDHLIEFRWLCAGSSLVLMHLESLECALQLCDTRCAFIAACRQAGSVAI